MQDSLMMWCYNLIQKGEACEQILKEYTTIKITFFQLLECCQWMNQKYNDGIGFMQFFQGSERPNQSGEEHYLQEVCPLYHWTTDRHSYIWNRVGEMAHWNRPFVPSSLHWPLWTHLCTSSIPTHFILLTFPLFPPDSATHSKHSGQFNLAN